MLRKNIQKFVFLQLYFSIQKIVIQVEQLHWPEVIQSTSNTLETRTAQLLIHPKLTLSFQARLVTLAPTKLRIAICKQLLTHAKPLQLRQRAQLTTIAILQIIPKFASRESSGWKSDISLLQLLRGMLGMMISLELPLLLEINTIAQLHSTSSSILSPLPSISLLSAISRTGLSPTKAPLSLVMGNLQLHQSGYNHH